VVRETRAQLGVRVAGLARAPVVVREEREAGEAGRSGGLDARDQVRVRSTPRAQHEITECEAGRHARRASATPAAL
jgi:hypothetical protein